MTGRVDFYVLPGSAERQLWTFACRLTEKAYLRDLRVVLLNETAAETAALDELLWTFNERSFVPHAIHGDGASATAAAVATVRLTRDLESIDGADLLVNLSGNLPSRIERFARIAEVIDAHAERRRRGRERFKAYRDLKLALETHQVNDAP